MSPSEHRRSSAAVRGILPLTDVDALNRMCSTLCDVVETTLAVSPPAPTNEAVAVPALTPQEFLFSALLDGPRPAIDIERMAREQHGWRPRIVFRARQQMRVKAMRRGFGPGGYWSWKLPEDATDKGDVFASRRMAQLDRGPPSKRPSPNPGCFVIGFCHSPQEFEVGCQHL